MRDSNKIKLKKLKFYTIDEDYIELLSKLDKHIAHNKNETRPYVGVVITVNNFYYFAPLFSPKQKHKTYKENLSFFKIINSKTKQNLGLIRFSDMIPVPLIYIKELDFEDKSYGYRRLISEQYSIINKSENKRKILEKATKLYNIVVGVCCGKTAKFYRSLSCDFKVLEEQCLNIEKK